MWFYDIINVIVAIAVIVAILYLLFRLFVLKQGNERVILLSKRKTSFQLADMNMSSISIVHAMMVTLKLSSSSLARVVQSAFTLP